MGVGHAQSGICARWVFATSWVSGPGQGIQHGYRECRALGGEWAQASLQTIAPLVHARGTASWRLCPTSLTLLVHMEFACRLDRCCVPESLCSVLHAQLQVGIRASRARYCQAHMLH